MIWTFLICLSNSDSDVRVWRYCICLQIIALESASNHDGGGDAWLYVGPSVLGIVWYSVSWLGGALVELCSRRQGNCLSVTLNSLVFYSAARHTKHSIIHVSEACAQVRIQLFFGWVRFCGTTVCVDVVSLWRPDRGASVSSKMEPRKIGPWGEVEYPLNVRNFIVEDGRYARVGGNSFGLVPGCLLLMV